MEKISVITQKNVKNDLTRGGVKMVSFICKRKKMFITFLCIRAHLRI